MSKPIKQLLIRADVLGSEVKLYNMEKSDTRAQTLIGGLLSIIVICLSISASTLFFMEIINKANPKAYQVTRFQDDVPKLTFDKNGMFFAIQYSNPVTPSFNLHDERAITFYGHMQTFKTNTIVAQYLFEKCSYAVDFQGLESLFTSDYINDINSNYLCINKMLLNGVLINKTDPNFISPYTIHGMGSKAQDPIFFEVGANRCVNSSINNNFCYSDDKIGEMLIGSNYKINFIDNMFDTNNYDKPVDSFVHQIDGQASPNNFAANYLNLLNIQFKTHNGLVFDNVDELNSFHFNDRVEIVSSITDGSPNVGRVFMFRLELQNTPIVYERYYTKLQEVLASIGGVLKFLFVAAKVLNQLLNFLSDKKRVLNNVMSHFVRIHHNEEDNGPPRAKLEKVAPKLAFVELDSSSNTNRTNRIPKSRKMRTKQRMSKSVKEATQVNIPSYFADKLRKTLTNEPIEETTMILDKCSELKRSILNELTIYKLFFDVEKIKQVLFNYEQNAVFNLIKVDFHQITENKRNTLEQERIVKYLVESDDTISKSLVRLLDYNTGCE